MLLPLDAEAICALLIIDMQSFFFRQPERRAGLNTVVANINTLSAHFDRRNWPVVHVRTAYQADGADWDLKMLAAGIPELIADSDEAAILPQINVHPGHIQLIKTRYSAFFNTPLTQWLTDWSVQRVMVVGAYTHYCVNATVFDAYACDFVPGLLTDAVISHLPEESEMLVQRMLRNGYHVMSTLEFIRSGFTPVAGK